MAQYRTVILEHRAARVIDEAATTYPRIRDMYDGLEWRICHSPESGEPIAGFDPPRRMAGMQQQQRLAFSALAHLHGDTGELDVACFRRSRHIAPPLLLL